MIFKCARQSRKSYFWVKRNSWDFLFIISFVKILMRHNPKISVNIQRVNESLRIILAELHLLELYKISRLSTLYWMYVANSNLKENGCVFHKLLICFRCDNLWHVCFYNRGQMSGKSLFYTTDLAIFQQISAGQFWRGRTYVANANLKQNGCVFH